MTESRKLAYEILVRCEKSGAYSNIMLQKMLELSELDGVDRAFVTNLVYGVLSRKLTLDYFVSKLYAKSISKLDLKVLVILRMGLYQLEYMDRVPESAAVNESVELCKRYVNRGAAGLVNGVLRSHLRSERQLPQEMSVRYSCDAGIAALLTAQYGESRTKEMLEESFLQRKLCVSVNTLKISTEDFCKKYDAVCTDGTCCEVGSQALRSDGFEKGFFFVQDYSSQQAVKLLAPQGGDTIADLCAAPGGKTLGSAVLMGNEGRIYAFDVHGNKLSLIENSCKRLGIDIVKTEQADARIRNKSLVGKMDKVICDVPCSGLGVMAKKPEIRYKRTEDFAGLYPLQKKILENGASYLKVGGWLLYSTCTVNKEENEKQVCDFLDGNDDYCLVTERTFFPTGVSDGFYAALIERTK